MRPVTPPTIHSSRTLTCERQRTAVSPIRPTDDGEQDCWQMPIDLRGTGCRGPARTGYIMASAMARAGCGVPDRHRRSQAVLYKDQVVLDLRAAQSREGQSQCLHLRPHRIGEDDQRSASRLAAYAIHLQSVPVAELRCLEHKELGRVADRIAQLARGGDGWRWASLQVEGVGPVASRQSSRSLPIDRRRQFLDRYGLARKEFAACHSKNAGAWRFVFWRVT